MAVSAASTATAPSASRSGGASRRCTSALTRRGLRDARVRTLAFAYLFAIYAYIQPVGYRHTYPTPADRLGFVHSFAGNDALRLFYGYPFDPLTVSGYSAWRVGGTLAILAAVFGVLAAVRALRGEEDAGRTELVLAAGAGRGAVYRSALLTIAAGGLILWAAESAGFILGGLPVGGSVYLALATVSVVPVYAGAGAIASQLASTRRLAVELAGATVVISLLVRVVADTASGAEWLRWATPLGWAEELRPFTGPRPLVLALPLAASVLSLALAARIARGRDIGTGTLPERDRAQPRFGLLSSPALQALRSERTSLILWLTGTAAFALVLGVVAASISSAGIPASVQRELAKLHAGSIQTPTGYLAFAFIFFVLAVSLLACAQVGAARHEEAERRLETLLALPVARLRWLGGRLLLLVCAVALVSLTAGFFTWAGAASQGVGVSLGRMLEAGANCLPAALLFAGVAVLLYAIAPRASGGLAYAVVIATFLWQLTGSLLGAPRWLVDLTPFAHVGLVPAQPIRVGAALAMLAIAALCTLTAAAAFKRRDLTGS